MKFNKHTILMIVTLSFSILTLESQGQECLNAKFKLRGYFYAGTSEVDTLALGGFYKDHNAPKRSSPQIINVSKRNELQIIASIDSLITINDKLNGFKVFVVNRTDSIVGFSAQDSRIYMIRQVYYQNEWKDIEYLPSSWCGNSYHDVLIKPDEYWEFSAPCLVGKIKANFRFIIRDPNGFSIVSNEFQGSFNKKQLTKEQGYQPNDIMDPYDN